MAKVNLVSVDEATADSILVGTGPGAAAWRPETEAILTGKDDWSASVVYAKNAVVAHSNKAWLAKQQTNSGDEPGVSSKWMELPIALDNRLDSGTAAGQVPVWDGSTYVPERPVRWADAPTGVEATDTAALQDQIDALPTEGGEVRMREGAYALNASLDLSAKNSITLSGMGRGGTTVTYTGTGDGVDTSAATVRRHTLRDFWLKGAGGARYGFHAGHSSEMVLERMRFTGFQAAIRFDGEGPASNTFVHSLRDVYIGSCTDGISAEFASALHLINCYISNNSGIGVLVDQCRSLCVLGGAIESNSVGIQTGNADVGTDGTCLGVTVLGTYFENNTLAAIWLGREGTAYTQGAFLAPGQVRSSSDVGTRCIILGKAAETTIAGGFLVSDATEASTLGHIEITADAVDTLVLPVSWAATGDHDLLDDSGTRTTSLAEGALKVPGNADVAQLVVQGVAAMRLTSNKMQIGQGASATPIEFIGWSDGVSKWSIDMPTGRPKWDNSGATQTTVGAAGTADALPANPTRWLQVIDSDGTVLVIPAFLAS